MKQFQSYNLEKGGALIEFAIIFPFFIGLVFTGFDLSMILIEKANLNLQAERALFNISRECIEIESDAIQILNESLALADITLDSSPNGDSSKGPNFWIDTDTDLLKLTFTHNLNCYFCSIIYGLKDKINYSAEYRIYTTIEHTTGAFNTPKCYTDFDLFSEL